MKLPLLILAAFLCAKGFCQIDIVNTTALVKPDSAILFKWIREPNVLKVAGVANAAGLQLRASRLQIEKAKEPFLFHTTALSLGADTLSLLRNGQVIFKKRFMVVNPQRIKAVLGTITDSVATIQQIISYAVLRAVIPDCRCFSGHVIAHFTVRFESLHIQEWEKEVSVIGSKLEQLNAIVRRLQPGDTIHFSNINTIDVDSFPLKLADFTITIR